VKVNFKQRLLHIRQRCEKPGGDYDAKTVLGFGLVLVLSYM